jgi:hypothetical protein
MTPTRAKPMMDATSETIASTFVGWAGGTA